MLRRLSSRSCSFEQKSDSIEETQYYYPSQTGLVPDPDSSSMFGGVEESEVVDELLQILVECMKKADIRGQEILLRKFFFEIEKEPPLERFLVERVKNSKISSLFGSIPIPPRDETFMFESELTKKITSTREINACEIQMGETTSSVKLERFKVRTVQVGVEIKEERSATSTR